MAEPTTELSPEVASILSRDSLEAAPALLGAVISVAGSQGRVAIRLTEVEAYRGRGGPGLPRLSRAHGPQHLDVRGRRVHLRLLHLRHAPLSQHRYWTGGDLASGAPAWGRGGGRD